CLRTFTEHTDNVHTLCFSPDARFLATGAIDCRVLIRAMADGKVLREYVGGGAVFDVVWHSTPAASDGSSSSASARTANGGAKKRFASHHLAVSQANRILAILDVSELEDVDRSAGSGAGSRDGKNGAANRASPGGLAQFTTGAAAPFWRAADFADLEPKSLPILTSLPRSRLARIKSSKLAQNNAVIDQLQARRLSALEQRNSWLDIQERSLIDTLEATRALVRSVVEREHQLAELWVEPEVLRSAVDAVVQQHNHKALRQLLFRPLSFVPAQHPAAFTDMPIKGFLYVREVGTDAQAASHAYRQAYPADRWWSALLDDQIKHEQASSGRRSPAFRSKYAGEYVSAISAQERHEEDQRTLPRSRLGNWLRLLQSEKLEQLGGVRVWTLVGVSPPGGLPPSHIAYRSDPIAQEMERVVIAILGPAALNSAAGGFHYPFDTRLYDNLVSQFRQHLDTADSSSAEQSHPAVRSRLNDKLRQMYNDFRIQLSTFESGVGRIISGSALTRALEMATSATRSPPSATVLKDVSQEALHDEEGTVSFFGRGAGPGPMLERRIWKAVDREWSGEQTAAPFLIRWFWDFWWAILEHVLIALHVHFLKAVLLATQPAVVRVESAKMAFIFAEGHILEPDTIKDVEWDDLPMAEWVEHLCDMLLLPLGNNPILIILSIHAGAIKYDPVLSALRARLLFCAILLHRAAEHLAVNRTAAEVRALLFSFKPLSEEIVRLKATLSQLQTALFSLRYIPAERRASDFDPSAWTRAYDSEELSAELSARVRRGNIKHAHALGSPWSEDRLQQWDRFIGKKLEAGSDQAGFTIVSSAFAIPFPPSMTPGTEEHKTWFCSRPERTDLVRAASRADAPSPLPGAGDPDFDWAEYSSTRRRACAARAEDKKLVVAGLKEVDALRVLADPPATYRPVHIVSCLNCGLGFLGDHNTRHRCSKDEELQSSRSPALERRLLLAAYEVAEDFGAQVTVDSTSNLKLIDVQSALSTSVIWRRFCQYGQPLYPVAFARVFGQLSVPVTEQRPAVIVASAASAVEMEYEALIWAVDQVFTEINGKDPISEPYRGSGRQALVKMMQLPANHPVVFAVCGEAPACEYAHYYGLAAGSGDRRTRAIQHEHQIDGSPAVTRPCDISNELSSIFDFPRSIILQLLITEKQSPPEEDRRSVLLWMWKGDAQDAVPFTKPSLSQAGYPEAGPSQPVRKRQRRRDENADRAIIAAMDESGAVTSVARQEIQLAFSNIFPSHRTLTDYIKNNKARLLSLREEEQAPATPVRTAAGPSATTAS
ncbi:hypothetical protein OC835_007497, partial [Tilletia horrida]